MGKKRMDEDKVKAQMTKYEAYPPAAARALVQRIKAQDAAAQRMRRRVYVCRWSGRTLRYDLVDTLSDVSDEAWDQFVFNGFWPGHRFMRPADRINCPGWAVQPDTGTRYIYTSPRGRDVTEIAQHLTAFSLQRYVEWNGQYFVANKYVEEQFQQLASEIVPNNIFKHYKGALYTLLSHATHSETLEPLVSYRALKTKMVWVRPAAMWTELVEWPDGVMRPRFVEYTGDLTCDEY